MRLQLCNPREEYISEVVKFYRKKDARCTSTMNTERIEMFDFFTEDDGEGEISIIARNKTTGAYRDVGEICYNCEYCHSALFTQAEAEKIALMICDSLKIEYSK